MVKGLQATACCYCSSEGGSCPREPPLATPRGLAAAVSAAPCCAGRQAGGAERSAVSRCLGHKVGHNRRHNVKHRGHFRSISETLFRWHCPCADMTQSGMLDPWPFFRRSDSSQTRKKTRGSSAPTLVLSGHWLLNLASQTRIADAPKHGGRLIDRLCERGWLAGPREAAVGAHRGKLGSCTPHMRGGEPGGQRDCGCCLLGRLPAMARR